MLVSWLSSPLNTTLRSDVRRAVRMSLRLASSKYSFEIGCGDPNRMSAARTSLACMETAAPMRLVRNPTPVSAATAIVSARRRTPSSPDRHSRPRLFRASPRRRMGLADLSQGRFFDGGVEHPAGLHLDHSLAASGKLAIVRHQY